LLSVYGPRLAGIESLTMASIALLMGVYNARNEQYVAFAGEPTVKLSCETETAKIVQG
jgi:hypothetical protein